MFPHISQNAFRCIGVALILTAAAPMSLAQSGSLIRGPYLNQSNESSIVIRWRSSASVVGRVRYGLSPAALNLFTNEASATTEHVVQLTGLAPYTRYYYSIGSPTDVLAGGNVEHTFRTSPTPGSPTNTRIWVLGDCGSQSEHQFAVRDAYYAWTGPRIPDLCLLLGDNAYGQGTDLQYQGAIFDMYGAFLRKMPLWSCLGNHDTAQSYDPEANFPYFDMFTFPTGGECGGVPSGTERYFSFDYGNIHFISLDSMTSDRAPDGPMAEWVQADLASTCKPWIIVLFHHPPYTKGTHDSDNLESDWELIAMRENFGPILEAGGVDLVLCGHSHVYERSYLIDGHYGYSDTFNGSHIKQPGDGRPGGNGAYRKPLTGPRDHFGAVYTVTGSAGNLGGGTLDHPAMFVGTPNVGSFNLDIVGHTLSATFIESDGAVTDTFTMIKEGAVDTDGDDIPDHYEILHGLNRHNPADAALDSDGDGFTNLEEWVLGLLASEPDRYTWTVARTAPNVTIIYPTLPGRTYRVWLSHDLLTWLPASSALEGICGPLVWIDDGTTTGTPPASALKRYYRVSVTLQ